MARVNTLWVAGFTADTPVLMVDGNTKPISKVKEGEWVASFDPKTKALRPGKVTGTLSEVMNEILEVTIDDKSMIVASSQRFFTPNGEWKTAPDAEAVLGLDGKAKKISAKKVKGLAKIYDITVRGDHAFFADGIMVHNGGGGGGGSPPKPPPDPVVTAGKIGKPLTVTVNGNVVTVPAAPGSAGQVSVSHSGGVSTNYNAVPGVAVLRQVKPLVKYPVDPLPTPLAAIQSAQANRDVVCDEMSNTTGVVSGAKKAEWKTYLKNIKNNIANAKRTDRINNSLSTRKLIYDDTVRDCGDLEKFLNKNKNFTSKDLTFINGKCSELEANLATLEASITGGGIYNPVGKDPSPGKDYSNEPGYAYYVTSSLDSSGKQTYTYAPPNAEVMSNRAFYKHFDTNNGLFYYDMTADNAI